MRKFSRYLFPIALACVMAMHMVQVTRQRLPRPKSRMWSRWAFSGGGGGGGGVAVSNPTLVAHEGNDAVGSATWSTTTVFTPPAGKVCFINMFALGASGATSMSSATGCGVTWNIDSRTGDPANPKNDWLVWGYASAPTSGSMTFVFSQTVSTASYQMWSVDNADTVNPVGYLEWFWRKDGNTTTVGQTYGWKFSDATNNASFVFGTRFNNGNGDNTYTNTTQVDRFQTASSNALLFVAWRAGQLLSEPMTWSENSDSLIAMMEVRSSSAPAANPLDERNFKVLKIANSIANNTNYSFSSVTTPTANTRVDLWILSQKSGGSGGATAIGGAGNLGLTWTKIGSTQTSGDFALVHYWGISATPSGTSLQIQHAVVQDSCDIIVVQTSGVNTSTPAGVNAQGTAISTTLTLIPSGGTHRNLFLAGWGVNVNMGSSAPWPGFVPGAGSSTGINIPGAMQDGNNDTPSNFGLVVTAHQYGDETSLSFTKSTAGRVLGSASEVVAA